MMECFADRHGVGPNVIDRARRAEASLERDKQPGGMIEGAFLIVRAAFGNAIDLPAPGKGRAFGCETFEFNSQARCGALRRAAQD